MARSTVQDNLKRAAAAGLAWPLADDVTDEALELRLFNGHSFGPAHTVPDTAGGGPEWFAVDQDPGGTVHVFNESTHLARTYGLYEQTTTTGASWDSPVDLGDAVDSTGFAVALDRSGSGLVLGTP